MKLEINYKKKTRKCTLMWKLNSMPLSKQLVKKKIKTKIKKIYLEGEENRNTIYKNLWYAAKAILR